MRRPLPWLVLALLGGLPTMAADPRGWYTPARLTNLRQNLAQQAWAQAQAKDLIARADGWLALGEPALRRLVPPPQVARAIIVHASGCPVHGAELNRIGMYKWILKPDQPWRVTCPVGGESYPSNDFAAYAASGFQDRTLLTGDYPDDGWGWRRPGQDRKYWFTGYWAHWAARSFLLDALRDGSQAYLISGDRRYAHLVGLLLWQLSVYYPDYRYEAQSRYGTEFDPHYYGRLLYHTWECFTVQEVAPAYDAVREALADDAALAATAGCAGTQVQEAIEERLLRTMARDILATPPRIQGNYGMHQVGLLQLAAILPDRGAPPRRAAMVEWVLRNDQVTSYTGLGLEQALDNLVHRDGFPFENPGYNTLWLRELTAVAEALRETGTDVYTWPRFRKLLRWPLELACAGQFTPALGDGGNLYSRVLGFNYDDGRAAITRLQDPAYSRAVLQDGAKPAPRLFEPALEELAAAQAAAHPEPVGVSSRLLPGLGYATLQTGTAANRSAVSLFYGYYVGHAHYDRLHLDLFSQGRSLLPDFGYPETADVYDPRRFGFFAHTVAHNTVLVDQHRQQASQGYLRVFDPGAGAQLLEVGAESAYPGVAQLYQRTLLLVDVTPTQHYLVEIFRVRGGQQHDWLVHGTGAVCSAAPDLGATRDAGTLAGPEVPYGQFYDDPDLRDKPVGTVSYAGYAGSGFQWLFNVQQAPLAAGQTVSWAVPASGANPGLTLRAHLVGRDETLLSADARPQNLSSLPRTVRYVVRRRQGPALESTFVTVFEPYREQPFVQGVRPLAVAGPGLPVALAIDTSAGPHLLLHRLQRGPRVTLPSLAGELTTDAAAVLAVADPAGQPQRAYVYNASGAQWGRLALPVAPNQRRRVTALDWATGSLTCDAPLTEVPAGGYLVTTRVDAGAAARVDRLLGGAHLSLGDDDLTCGRFNVTAVEGETLRVNPPFVYLAWPGVAVVDAAGRSLGRLTARGSGSLTVSAPPARLTDLPADERGRRMVRCVVLDVGDELELPMSRRWQRD
ncbi:MAG: heparinase II/III family protein [Fimbriimonadaceae bacterium]|nr:heparinase II/III family protein [Fimbriimonadaceae bacterium]